MEAFRKKEYFVKKKIFYGTIELILPTKSPQITELNISFYLLYLREIKIISFYFVANRSTSVQFTTLQKALA